MPANPFDLGKFVSLARRIGTDTTEVEVKTASIELPKGVCESISAFANGSGGVIVCGLSEKDGFTVAQGFDAAKTSESLAQMCCDKLEPPVRADIQVREFEGAFVVVACIPETAPYLKPCYIKARGPYDGSFIRTGEGDRRLSRYEVDRLIEERTQPLHDSKVIAGATSDDLDPELVDGFLRRERAASPRVFAGLCDQDALLTMGVLKRDDSGDIRPTLAGLMAMGRHPQEFFPRANVTFAVFPGTSKDELSKDGVRFLDSRTIIGPIPVMVAETLASVRRNSRVVSRIEGGSRHDEYEYPEVAVREAVANALMHRDYSPEGLGSQVQVNMFADRLEVINPGGLYGTVTVDNLGQYGSSSCRNQYLSRILESTPYPVGYPESGYVVENKGTGYAQIQATLRACGMPAAEPVDTLSSFVLTMRNRDGVAARGPKAQVETPAPVGYRGEASSIVEIARAHGLVTTTDIVKKLGISRSTALRRINELVEGGYLVPGQKQGRSISYMPR